jgi:hypothetical protein
MGVHLECPEVEVRWGGVGAEEIKAVTVQTYDDDDDDDEEENETKAGLLTNIRRFWTL